MDLAQNTLPVVRFACRNRITGPDRLPLRQLCDHLLILGVRETGAVILDGGRYAVPPDSLFLLTPGSWYEFSGPPDGFEFLAVHFDWRRPSAGICPTTYRRRDEPPASLPAPERLPSWPSDQPAIDLSGRPKVGITLADLVRVYGRWDDLTSYETSALLAVALGQIEREARLIATVAKYEHVGADAVRRVETARRMLESLDAPRRIDDIASAVGWSADHLRRMCRAVLGTSPVRVQRNAVIRRAKDLLADNTLSVAEVSEFCGCGDQAYFGRIFKEETGTSPGQFRARMRDEAVET